MTERTEAWLAFRFARAEASVRLLRASPAPSALRCAASMDERADSASAVRGNAGPSLPASLAGGAALMFQVRKPPPVLARLSVRVVELPWGRERVKLAGVTPITGAPCTSK